MSPGPQCLSLIPEGWQEQGQGCSSHPGAGLGGEQGCGTLSPLQGPGTPLGMPKVPSATTHPISTHQCQQHIWGFRLNLEPLSSF